MKVDQAHEARIFNQANVEEIEKVRAAVHSAADLFLQSSVTKVIPEAVPPLANMLSARDYDGFYLVLRQYATQFVDSRYWDVIDAVGAFTDAIGSFWPYMTQATRCYRLKHAIDHLAA